MEIREINHLRCEPFVAIRAIRVSPVCWYIKEQKILKRRYRPLSSESRPPRRLCDFAPPCHAIAFSVGECGFASKKCGEKNLSGPRRYQAVPAGTKRYDGRARSPSEPRAPPRILGFLSAGSSRRNRVKAEATRAKADGLPYIPQSAIRTPRWNAGNQPLTSNNPTFCILPSTFCLFSHGPTTRQYPAIPGNTRTLAQFLAA
jgi:hypothetical protein